MMIIGASVGLGGRNKPTDVALIQQLLNQVDSSRKLTIDGLINPQTINAITHFQKSVAKINHPDSRVNANGYTLKALIKAAGYNPATRLTATLGSIGSDRFVALYNKQYNNLASANQRGLTDLIGFIAKDTEITNICWAAYMLATTMHETDRKWLPVEEYGKGGIKEYAKKIEVSGKDGKKYNNIYYGRGYVQLTWEKNYKRLGKALGMGDDLHIHPAKALEPDTAYKM